MEAVITPSVDSGKSSLRLNKAIAHAGLASRRAADALIAEGRVTVNGEIVLDAGRRVALTDAVTVDGQKISLPADGDKTCLMVNKPIHVVSTANDPQGRKTILDILPDSYAPKRLYPVGRLDYFSEGLLLVTDDGDLTLRLTHPRYHLPRVYHVTLREKPDADALKIMREGMTLSGGERLAPVRVRLPDTRETVLEMTLRQGVNRQIRRMCQDLSLTILRLVRVSFGPLHLGNLASGTARPLSGAEIAALKNAVGL
ncbi:ribosomal large subunit pseudouridine synthase B [Deltaproteobacteria bacterium]|nr:ribosomal large subunit pseudouridine synthase B [Deltaproteobacteria bacterium]